MTHLSSSDLAHAPSPSRRRHWHANPHARTVLCLMAGATVALLLPTDWRLTTRGLLGWNTATILFIALTLAQAKRPGQNLSMVVSVSDQGRLLTLAASIVAAAVSLSAVVAELMFAKQDAGLLLLENIALTVATVVATWAFIHFKFAMHYANQYLNGHGGPHGDPRRVVGGLDFPGNPDVVTMGDFLYFSYIIGLATSTADIGITSGEIRRTALVQGVFAFFFNMTVLGLTINLVSGAF